MDLGLVVIVLVIVNMALVYSVATLTGKVKELNLKVQRLEDSLYSVNNTMGTFSEYMRRQAQTRPVSMPGIRRPYTASRPNPIKERK